jgi:CHAP domain-containing protein
MNAEDIRRFQSANSNHRGDPLNVDGVLGPETRWAMAVDGLPPDRKEFVLTACDCVGFVEDPIGSNDDPNGWIRGLLARCGVPADLAWCAAFASWVVRGPKIAGAQRLGQHYPKTMNPTAGDLMWFATGPITGHCGIVIGVSLTEVMTVEGNLDNRVQCVRRPRMHCNFGVTCDEKAEPPPIVVFGVPLKSVGRAGTR